jgi:DNA recombination protein RmuC
MIVTMSVLMVAVVVAAALGALLAWTAAATRANAARNHHEAELSRLKTEHSSQLAELARLTEQCKRLPELTDERDLARGRSTQLDAEIAGLRQRLGSYESGDENQQKRILRVEQDLAELGAKHEEALNEELRLASQLAAAEKALEAEQKQTAEKLALIEGAREQLSNQFKALANDILEEKSKRFVEQNQTSLGQLLDPLKTQLEQFRGRVDEVYVQESKDRSALTAQVQQLMDLNQQISADAVNLTKALKGSSKTQGNWGELILERVLEAGGLRKGEEYSVQDSHTREDGSRGQPDVVINLPEHRHLVVDAKVSLVAYEEQVNAESDMLRDAALNRHVDSVRAHIKGLSAKSYQNLYGLETLDFVIMFIPIEPAFMLAISRDPKLWQDAWRRNVLLVSPSTLLFVVRTVSHLWRQEKQNRSVQEIVTRGAQLYDKLCGFINDLTGIGDRLAQASTAYEDAFRKLSTGNGNVIRQAQMLKELGVKPTKSLPEKIVSLAAEDPLRLPSINRSSAIESMDFEAQLSLATAADPEV